MKAQSQGEQPEQEMGEISTMDHLKIIKMLTAYYAGKKLFIECFPTDADAIHFPNSNRAVKEIEWPENFPQPSKVQENLKKENELLEAREVAWQNKHSFLMEEIEKLKGLISEKDKQLEQSLNALSLYSQSKEGEDKGNVDIDNLIEYCNDWAGNVGRYWHTDKPFQKAAESMYTPEQVIVDYFKQLENDLFALAAVVSQTENKVGLNTINALIEKVQKVKRESPKI